MNLPQLLSAAVDGAGAAAEPPDMAGMGRSRPREATGTVQHAHREVTPRARGCRTARPAPPTWGAGAAAPGRSSTKGQALWNSESHPGAGSPAKSCHHWNQCRAGCQVEGETILRFLCAPSPSHCPAVLDAALGRNARPGQEAAEEALGLSVYPLGDGARAQAG